MSSLTVRSEFVLTLDGEDLRLVGRALVDDLSPQDRFLARVLNARLMQQRAAWLTSATKAGMTAAKHASARAEGRQPFVGNVEISHDGKGFTLYLGNDEKYIGNDVDAALEFAAYAHEHGFFPIARPSQSRVQLCECPFCEYRWEVPSNLTWQDYDSCPKCRGSFSFAKPKLVTYVAQE